MEFIKKNWKWLFPVIIVVYTIIVIFLTITIYKNYLGKKVQDAFKDAFSETFNINSEETDESKEKEKQNQSIKDSKPKTNTKLDEDVSVIEDDVYEITYRGCEFTKKVLPPVQTSFYTYYEAKEEGHQYLVIKLDYKNLEATGISADEVANIDVKYNNKYEYSTFSTIVDSDGDFTYSSITSIKPLTTGKLYYLCDIPDEVANGTESVVAYVNAKGKTYEIKIR